MRYAKTFSSTLYVARRSWVGCALGGAAALVGGCTSSGGAPGTAAAQCPLSGSHMVARAADGSASFEETAAQDRASLAEANATGRATMRTLRGHKLATTLDASDQGAVGDEQDIPVTVSLAINHADGLASELAELYDPSSPKYHQFLKTGEFKAKYGPTPEQVSQVTSYLEAQGLRSVAVDASGLLVHATGKASELAQAFGTQIHQYKDAQGNAFRAPSDEPRVPAGLAIQAVHGLQDQMHAHTHLRKLEGAPQAGGHAATGPSGGFSPTDIRQAYNIPSNPDAGGETLALFELDGYTTSDVTGYEQKFGLPNVPLQNVLVDGSSGSAGGGAAEVTLDIELMIALAPNASKILVYEGPNNDQGMLDTYARIASDNLAKSVSTSWGTVENGASSSFLQSENTIFMQMAAQGQTIYSAAGDSGANDNGSSLSIDDPSGQPYVTAVGGTSLTTNSSGARQSETTWNDSSGGGGGGISTVWSIPTWQQGLASSANKASSTMRNIPDVALNADIATGYAIYYQGGWSVWGGTSCAAPLWAAFNALVNRTRATAGLGPIGYINPVLYSIGKSKQAQDFFDIADNSTNGYYPAVAGYDDATGWGSFNATSLLGDLSAPTVPTSGSGSGSSNSCGG